MLGISDPYILLAFLMSIALALVCIAYGVINWNKGDE